MRCQFLIYKFRLEARKFISPEFFKEIAKIPSREELLSKFLGSIQSPVTNFARVLNQLAEKGGAEGAAAAE